MIHCLIKYWSTKCLNDGGSLWIWEILGASYMTWDSLLQRDDVLVLGSVEQRVFFLSFYLYCLLILMSRHCFCHYKIKRNTFYKNIYCCGFIYFWPCWGFCMLHAGFLWLRRAAFWLQWLLLLWSTGSGVVVHGFSCPAACGIFPD